MSAPISANFEAFSNEIQRHPQFVSLVEEGSAAVGDPWQQGYSDHDLHVVTEEDLPSDLMAVQGALLRHPLGDTYLVTHHRRADFTATGHTLNDLSVQYRSSLIAGEDLVAQRPQYNRPRALTHGFIGLQAIEDKLDKRILNAHSWTEDRLRHESYDLLKKWFCYNAAVVFGRGEAYPVQRESIVEHLPDAEIGGHILRVTHSIATAEKYELIGVLSAARDMTAHILHLPRPDEQD